jgi:hypothetical protein
MHIRAIPILLSPLLFATLLSLPALGVEDRAPITKKDLNASKQNLKEIALAFLNYESANGYYAGDYLDKAEKPILSWRVALLPYLEESNLFNQFKLDEPWDSENNKKLIEKMPKVYAPVRVKAKAGETFYQVFEGEDALFSPKIKRTIVSITDGTSNTGLVFEAGEPVIWTKPSNLPFDKKKPLPKLGGIFDSEIIVAMCDGSVRHLKKNPDEEQLKYLIMPQDGNVIDFDKLDY